MKTVKKKVIQLVLFIAAIVCIEAISFCVCTESKAITEISAPHCNQENPESDHCDSENLPDEFIHDHYTSKYSATDKDDHFHSHECSIPNQFVLSIWQPPKSA